MRKIVVAGTSGSGKSTLARQLSAVLGLPYTELDSLFHGPNWTPLPNFEADVDRMTQAGAWVTEWQYASVKPMLLERADTLVWLDLPFPLTLFQVTRRTIGRHLRRQELWNGNYEPPLRTLFTDPDHIIRWAIKTRRVIADSMPDIRARYPELLIVRLKSRGQIRRFLDDVVATLPE